MCVRRPAKKIGNCHICCWRFHGGLLVKRASASLIWDVWDVTVLNADGAVQFVIMTGKRPSRDHEVPDGQLPSKIARR